MSKKTRGELDALIEEITVDAYGEQEQLWAIRQALEDNIHVPFAATVIGEPVQVTKFDYDGNERRGLTATCRMGIAPHPANIPQTTSGDVGTKRPERSGSIEVAILSVKQRPLRVREWGTWKPEEHYWGDPGAPAESWAKPIISRGSRPLFEMEQVLPGEDPDDAMTDPIIEANDHKEAGDYQGAREVLMELCRADLRCLETRMRTSATCYSIHAPPMRSVITKSGSGSASGLWETRSKSVGLGLHRQSSVPSMHARFRPVPLAFGPV